MAVCGETGEQALSRDGRAHHFGLLMEFSAWFTAAVTVIWRISS